MKRKNLRRRTRIIIARSSQIFVTVIIFVVVFSKFLENPLIFASFASSVFTIFALPTSHQAQPKVVVGSQLIAAFTGYGLTFVFPIESPVSAALAVGISSGLMILFRVRHAPSAATALSFSYNLAGFGSWMNFLIVLVMIACLGAIKAVAHFGDWLMEEVEEELGDVEKWWRKLV